MEKSKPFVFDSLVETKDDFVGMVAYTLYKRQKVEWIEEFKESNGRPPTLQDIEAGFGSVCSMSSQREAYIDQAITLIDEFLDQALSEKVQQATQEVTRSELVKAVKKPMWKSVLENLIASGITSLVIIGAIGALWVTSQGPERLVKDTIRSYLEDEKPDQVEKDGRSKKQEDIQKRPLQRRGG